MKFVCNDCQRVMEFRDNTPGQGGGSMAIRYICPGCNRSISMVTNPGETQVVRSLGVTIGHEAIAHTPEPMAMIREALAEQKPAASVPAGPDPVWTETALRRLNAAPGFVQGMIRRLYDDYARQKGYAEITPAVMNEARDALGMSEM